MKFCLIGDATLTIQCAELLLSHQHEIVAVVSERQTMQHWAAKQSGIACYSDLAAFKEHVLPNSFDYLLSIVNYRVLDESVLKLPRCLAINFHDSPLPRYAGIHAPQWALLQGEYDYAISWHVMEVRVDEGDLLAQPAFRIPASITAHQLNLLCYQHAIKSFEDVLLPQFSAEQPLKRTPQNLTGRTYFELPKKPTHCGFIRWDEQGVTEINRLFLASQFSPSDNTFYSTKLLIRQNDQDTVLFPTELTTLKRSAEKVQPISDTERCVAQVRGITDHGVDIACRDGIVKLIALKTVDNRVYRASDWFQAHLIRVGDTLPTINAVDLKVIEKYYRMVAWRERKWVTTLEQSTPSAIFPHLAEEKLSLASGTFPMERLNQLYELLPPSHKSLVSREQLWIALFVIYFYKINQYTNAPIFFEDQRIDRLTGLATSLFSRKSLLAISLTPEMTLSEVLDTVAQTLSAMKKPPIYPLDFSLRYPSVSEKNHGLHILIADDQPMPDSLESDPFVYFNPQTGEMHYPVYPASRITGRAFFSKMIERMAQMITCYGENAALRLRDYSLRLPAEKQGTDSSITAINTLAAQSLKPLFLPLPPSTPSILTRFEQAVQRYPDRMAVRYEEHALTYRELNAYADLLAERLPEVDPSSRGTRCVVVYLDRGIEFIAALIAVWKKGLAYVPVDFLQPPDRVAYIVQDASPVALMTAPDVELDGAQKFTISLSRDRTAIQERLKSGVVSSLQSACNSGELAYMIYTSGTTGKPKGVKITHGNLTSLFEAAAEHFCFSESDAWTLLHSLSFDFSVWEMWGALIHGSKLVVVPQSVSQSPEAFWHLLQREHITVLNQTPSYFSQLTDHLINGIKAQSWMEPGKLPLRYIIFGGERLPSSTVKRWFDWNLNEELPCLVNMYGITEITVHASYQKITRAVLHGETVPIGKPLSSLGFYLLDAYQQPVPPGVMAELFIRGSGVSQGYCNRDEDTQKAFLTINRPQESGVVPVYRTGDEVMEDEQGNYHYLGRLGRQLKIRGYRVELGEIDATVKQQNNVKDSFTIGKKGEDGLVSIVTYMVLKGTDSVLDEKSLKKILSLTLPVYMIPSCILYLDRFPLTLNGKVDMAALPDPRQRISLHRWGLFEGNPTRQLITSIWSELLGRDDISPTEDFSRDLGGNSLTLANMLATVSRLLGVSVPFASFVKEQTLLKLEQLLVEQSMNATKKPVYDFLKDRVLSDKIVPLRSGLIPNPVTSAQTQTVLLTGATSFLGLHLLRALLKQSRTNTVYLLLRQKNGVEPLGQLGRNYQALHKELLESHRIRVLIGDLEKSQLGLTPARFQELATEITAILHSAAWVNHLLPYESLKPANVEGTRTLIELSCQATSPLPIHYISSLSAAIDHNAEGAILETFPHSHRHLDRLINGYVQSKWVAENLLAQAQQRGVTVTVHRLNWVLGEETQSFTTAAHFQNNHLVCFVQSCLSAGIAPDSSGYIDALPADWIASQVVRVMQQTSDGSRTEQAKVYHYSNPKARTWREWMTAIAESQNKTLQWESYPSWKEVLFSHSGVPLNAFYSLYQESNYPYVLTPAIQNIQRSHLDQLLATFGENYPPVSENLLKNVFLLAVSLEMQSTLSYNL